MGAFRSGLFVLLITAANLARSVPLVPSLPLKPRTCLWALKTFPNDPFFSPSVFAWRAGKILDVLEREKIAGVAQNYSMDALVEQLIANVKHARDRGVAISPHDIFELLDLSPTVRAEVMRIEGIDEMKSFHRHEGFLPDRRTLVNIQILLYPEAKGPVEALVVAAVPPNLDEYLVLYSLPDGKNNPIRSGILNVSKGTLRSTLNGESPLSPYLVPTVTLEASKAGDVVSLPTRFQANLTGTLADPMGDGTPVVRVNMSSTEKSFFARYFGKGMGWIEINGRYNDIDPTKPLVVKVYQRGELLHENLPLKVLRFEGFEALVEFPYFDESEPVRVDLKERRIDLAHIVRAGAAEKK